MTLSGLLPRWEIGRQEGGYTKLRLFQIGKVDCYILRYPPKSGIMWHLDPVPGHRHYRLNLKYWPLSGDDRLVLRGRPLFRWGPLVLFRPDEVRHRVLEITGRTRYVFSLGWARSVA